MPVKLFSETVAVGTELPAWSRTTNFMHWNRFAAVNDEFMPFHMDDEDGRAAGNPHGAFGMGNLRFSYMLNALHDWIGDEATIHELSCRYRIMNQKGDTLTVVGKVIDKVISGELAHIRLAIDVVNQKGESTCPGHAIVVLPSRGT
ncbi:MAG: MaoC/PaaZ C-terminal domain-containing protein [Hyphomonadaceae bacterium]